MDEQGIDDVYSVQTPGTSVWLDKATWMMLKGFARTMTTHEHQQFVEVTSINGTEHAFFIDYATIFAHTTRAQREAINQITGAYVEEIPPKKEPWE